MKFTERIRKSADSIWEKSHQHPFVQGIGNGTLDIESFKFYMCRLQVFDRVLKSNRDGNGACKRFRYHVWLC